MNISKVLKEKLTEKVNDIKKQNPPQTQEEELAIYDQAMSLIKKDHPEVFSPSNEADQLAMRLAK